MRTTSEPTVCSRATVIGLEGGMARVEVARKSMCDNCEQEGACHTLLDSGRDTQALVHNPAGAKPGDTVEIAVGEGILVRGSLILYILPLVFMLAGILLALWVKGKMGWGISDDILALLSALAGLVVSVPLVGYWSSRSGYVSANTPVITRVLEEGES